MTTERDDLPEPDPAVAAEPLIPAEPPTPGAVHAAAFTPSAVEGLAPSGVEGLAPSVGEGPVPGSVQGFGSAFDGRASSQLDEMLHQRQLDRLASGHAIPAGPLDGTGTSRVEGTPTRLGFDRRASRFTRIGEELVAWFKTLTSAAVYATLIVTFGFQVARVEGQSMAPTLADQDRLIVNKLAYRIGQPRVGDIVMLYYPLNPDKSFVKRVIAEEGDQVRIVDGRVYRNEVPLDDDYVPMEYRSHEDWGPKVIPEGYYFVMGDHRNNSSDSRHWGEVPKKYIIGRVQLRWWPLPKARLF